MSSFLEYALDQFPEWEHSPRNHVFVLPSKRAGFFLKNLMAKRVKSTVLAPQIWSIEDFVTELSGLRQGSEIHLLFQLYEVYQELDLPEKESFESFSKWGLLLLQDFNEIDRYLIDSNSLFQTLSNLQEIRNWSPDGHPTAFMEKRLAFWRHLAPLYEKFTQTLLQQNIGYQGMCYRSAAYKAALYSSSHRDKHFVFLGFNALNAAEIQIIRAFLQEKNGKILWDADPLYLSNSYHEAGLYLRRHLKEWPELKGELKGVQEHLNAPKTIEIIGIPKSVAQAKYAGKLLEKLINVPEETLQHTALILGNELLLDPILNSLPAAISSANVTMGYPLKQSPATQLFELLLLQARQNSGVGWYVRNVLEILGNPFLRPLFQKESFDSEQASAYLIREHIVTITPQYFEEIGLSLELRRLLFPETPPDPEQQLRHFRSLILMLRNALSDTNDRVNLEALFRLDQLFNQLVQMCQSYPVISTLGTLEVLFKELLSNEKLDFEGEPLEGLQIMGMLESRNLDFETVILTSVNEGILPAGKSNLSFIPFDVKKEYGLPTYKEKDAVYAYHFYRLLQRAKRVYLLYNTEPDTLEGGEASRFLSQLKTEPKYSGFIQEFIAAPELLAEHEKLSAIPKNSLLLEQLKVLSQKGFSPTSLSKYLENPIDFYKRYILKIQEPDLLEETIAANTFGTVIHKVLEKLYEPFLGQELNQTMLSEARKRGPNLAEEYFKSLYLKESVPRGRNLIALRVLKQYVDTFLRQEQEQIKSQSIRIIGLEADLECPIDVPGLDFPVILKGTVDRIEEVNGIVQIIDYKSGLVLQNQIRIADWSDAFSKIDKSKAMQLLCYAWLYSKHYPTQSLRAGIVSFKNLSSGKMWFGLQTGGRSYEDSLTGADLDLYKEELVRLIQEIWNPNVPFTPKDPETLN